MPDPGRNSKASRQPDWANAIRELRVHLKLTQTDLGARIGFSAMTVSRWERGAQEPPSHGYIALGNLSRDTNCWYFWERAGLRSEDVLRVLPPLAQSTSTTLHDLEIVAAGSGRKSPKDKLQLVAIPLLKVTAGSLRREGDKTPLLIDAPVESMIAAPKDWCPNPSHTTCLRVRGNSMTPLIQDGFVVAVDTSETDPSKLHGKIVIAGNREIGLAISRFHRFNHTEVLQSENAQYEAVTLGAKSPWRIVATVLWWIGRAP